MDESPAVGDWFAQNRATWDERAALHSRDANGFYALDRFREGEDTLLDIEGNEIGDVVGRHLLHLQCHIGLDTLCLARRGAIVTGLDFSNGAIEAARRLSSETSVPGHFIQSDVYDAPDVLRGDFDIVFVNWGSLNWLPDVWAWGRVVAQLLGPGGFLYLVDQHPAVAVMAEVDGVLQPSVGWRTPRNRPIVTDMPTTYNGDETPLVNTRLHEWEHPLSDIIGALRAAGLTLDFFHEFELLPWQRFPMLERANDRYFRLPAEHPAMPLAFSLKAYKPSGYW